MSPPPFKNNSIQLTGIINSPGQQAHFSYSLCPGLSVLLSVSQGLHASTHTKALTNPSVIFNHMPLCSHCFCHHLFYCIGVCVAASSVGSSVVSAVLHSLFFSSSVQLFPQSPHQPLAISHTRYFALLINVFTALSIAGSPSPVLVWSCLLYNHFPFSVVPCSN